MQLNINKVKQIMHKLEVEMVKCKHHYRGFVTYNGVKLFPIHCSLGKKDLPGNVPHRFRKSLKLDIEEFEYLCSCHMKKQEYFQILIDKQIVKK